MKKVHDASMVAHLWAHQSQEEARTSSNNFSFDGPLLRSYSTSIGWHFGTFVLLSRSTMTSTTSGQISAAAGAARHLRVVRSGLFRYGRYVGGRDLNGQAILDELVKELEWSLADLLTKKAVTTKTRAAGVIQGVVEDIEFISQHFGLPVGLPEMPADLTELATVATQFAAEKEAREEKARMLLQKADEAKFKNWLKGESIQFPNSFQRHKGTDYITIRGDEVVTSQGARAPISHVVKAIDFYLLKRWPWAKNGHRVPLGHFELDSIDEKGNCRAGCHTFSAAELKRFIKKWHADMHCAATVAA